MTTHGSDDYKVVLVTQSMPEAVYERYKDLYERDCMDQCGDDAGLRFGYVTYRFESSEINLLVLTKDEKKMLGFCCMDVMPAAEWMESEQCSSGKSKACVVSEKLGPKDMILFIHLLCTSNKLGSKVILPYIESVVAPKYKAKLLVLQSIKTAHTFYIKNGFLRSRDGSMHFPVSKEKYVDRSAATTGRESKPHLKPHFVTEKRSRSYYLSKWVSPATREKVEKELKGTSVPGGLLSRWVSRRA